MERSARDASDTQLECQKAEKSPRAEFHFQGPIGRGCFDKFLYGFLDELHFTQSDELLTLHDWFDSVMEI